MVSKLRYLAPFIRKDLNRKMVFLGGPRQVGKTTLARTLSISNDPHAAYLNWDDAEDRRSIRSLRFPADATWLVLDEVHKFVGWRNHIKGLFDKQRERYRILVTGSTRLDYYRRGGDSLLGRYHYYRLHPFSVREVVKHPETSRLKFNLTPFEELIFPPLNKETIEASKALIFFGGFPEPFLAQDPTTLRRWHLDRRERLLDQDIRDVEALRDLNKLEMLMDLLPSKVGSLFSLNSLREDLGVTHQTLTHWVDILERFYVHFRLRPFRSNRILSLRKEPKIYLWDWSEAPEGGARLENYIASHLLKFVHFLRDVEGYKTELFFLRDREQRETDFLVTVDQRPWFAVEVKTSDDRLSKPLKHFGTQLNIPFLFQVSEQGNTDTFENGVRKMGAAQFVSGLL